MTMKSKYSSTQIGHLIMQANIRHEIEEKKHQLNVWRAQLHALMDDLRIDTITEHGLTIDNTTNTAIMRVDNKEVLDKYMPFNIQEFDMYEDIIVYIINKLKDKRMFGE